MTKEELLEEAKRRYPVGTKYKTASNSTEDDIYTVTRQSFCININNEIVRVHGETGKGCLYHDGKWAEIISESKHEPKYKKGDKVQVCQSYKCNGFGYYDENTDHYDAIDGVGNNTGKIDFLKYSSSKNEWYYHLDCHYGGSYIAEHALSLMRKEAKFQIGQCVYLLKDKLGINKGTKVRIDEIYYDDDTGKPTYHFGDGYAGYFSEDILSLTDPEEKPMLRFEVGDIVGINLSSEYNYQAMDVETGETVSGEIISIKRSAGDYCYNVRWKNDKSNFYRDEDLIPWNDYERKKALRKQLLEMYPVGTIFTPIDVHGAAYGGLKTVKEDWNLHIGNLDTFDAAWFQDDRDHNTHAGFIHYNGKYASITIPTPTPDPYMYYAPESVSIGKGSYEHVHVPRSLKTLPFTRI